MKKILIIETEYEGHYLTGYIKYILRSFKEKKIKIILLTSIDGKKKAKGPLKILRNEKVKFQVEVINNIKINNYSSLNLFINQIKLYFIIKKKFELLNSITPFDYIFVTSVQKFDKALALLGSPFADVNFTGIFLGAKFHLNHYDISHGSRFNYLSEIIFKKLLKISTLQNIITNDHLLESYVKLHNWKGFKKLKFFHDPKEFNFYFSKLEARQKLGLQKNSILILVYGALIDSKGIIELLSIFRESKLHKNIKVILAGKQMEEIKYFLKNSNFVKKLIFDKKIYLFNSWIDEKIESLLFSATDIVWIGYKNYFSPSGVLYQAIHKSRPVIISNDGLINRLNKKIKVGYALNIFKPLNIIEGINFVLQKKNIKRFRKNIFRFSRISNSKKWVIEFKNMHAKLYL
jgi:hypothetical protein